MFEGVKAILKPMVYGSPATHEASNLRRSGYARYPAAIQLRVKDGNPNVVIETSFFKL